MRVCIVGASGKLGQYMVQHALDRDYGRWHAGEGSVAKLDAFKGRITVIQGATNDREVIERAVAGCDGVLVVLVPRGVHGTRRERPRQCSTTRLRPRLVFSCGWHITRDGKDVYSWKLKALVKVAGPVARLVRFADLDDQVEACRRVSRATRDGLSCGEATWRKARIRPWAGTWAPILESNITRRVDFALFMEAAERRARPRGPAIVGCRTPRRSRTLGNERKTQLCARAGRSWGPYEVPRGVLVGWLAGAVHAPGEWRRAA